MAKRNYECSLEEIQQVRDIQTRDNLIYLAWAIGTYCEVDGLPGKMEAKLDAMPPYEWQVISDCMERGFQKHLAPTTRSTNWRPLFIGFLRRIRRPPTDKPSKLSLRQSPYYEPPTLNGDCPKLSPRLITACATRWRHRRWWPHIGVKQTSNGVAAVDGGSHQSNGIKP
jgi:hypothetical protein